MSFHQRAPEDIMTDPDITAKIGKLKLKAVQLKLELHDLSEDLPLGWEKIPEVASRCHAAYQELASLQAVAASPTREP
jgi:hypothetical protein